jgi:WS/DGAT/MGAT family acyltransferase
MTRAAQRVPPKPAVRTWSTDPQDRGRAGFDRLSAVDLTNLAVEAPDTPMHVAALLVLDGTALLAADGQLPMAEIRSRIESGLCQVPKLRQIVYRPRPFGGRPLWVDDPHFALGRHLRQVEVEAPGGSEQLLRLTARLIGPLLDRSHPLWRLCFVTGLPDGRLAVVVELHHAIADGTAAIPMIRSLLNTTAADLPAPWTPAAAPRWRALVADNAAARAAAVARAVRRLADPRAGARLTRSFRAGWNTAARGGRAPRTSLNQPVGPRRRLAVVRLDLAAVRQAGHASGATVNDVVLSLIAGGLRGLLHARGEPVDGVALRASVAVTLRMAGESAQAGNRAGVIVVELPLGEAEPRVRLRSVSAAATHAKRGQVAAAEQYVMVWLAKLGLMRYVTRRQRLVNILQSDLPGPPERIRLLGAPVLELIPVGVLAGNLTIAFLAFSYAGTLTITVCADADRYPDLPVVLAAMNRDWNTLEAGTEPG